MIYSYTTTKTHIIVMKMSHLVKKIIGTLCCETIESISASMWAKQQSLLSVFIVAHKTSEGSEVL